ncbi:hypothetical protein RHGRI_015861 [Rhododendron griersonianum]|uniref:Uncharacterized protein n=1 Tax=Rhododendron griersonianum TaxID=479676 RepID=A0AAV6JSQ4_9ERIC|nr:hypothetical protein RHGRI_015861 [Rhododendron griersonianum]
MKKLREVARDDNGRKAAAVNLKKLILLIAFCVSVICYVFFTRIVVYALEMVTSYRYHWTSVVAGELATLVFYVYMGYKLKPGADNLYFAADDEEEEAVDTAEGGAGRRVEPKGG